MSILTKIAAKSVPANIVLETESLIVIRDIAPVAPIHLLILPKKPYRDLQSIPHGELQIVTEIAAAARHLAKEFDVQSGYRLLTNNGQDAGQSEDHLHFHFLAGRKLGSLG